MQIAAHWSPKQISSLSGGMLKPNLIAHRIMAARLQVGEKQEQKGNKKSRKRKRDDGAAPEICEDGFNKEQHDVESEASHQFRINQLELQEAVLLKDPDFELRQVGCRKKMPKLDRILIDQAFEEREKKRKAL